MLKEEQEQGENMQNNKNYCSHCKMANVYPYYCMCFWRDWILHHGVANCEANLAAGKWHSDLEEMPSFNKTDTV